MLVSVCVCFSFFADFCLRVRVILCACVCVCVHQCIFVLGDNGVCAVVCFSACVCAFACLCVHLCSARICMCACVHARLIIATHKYDRITHSSNRLRQQSRFGNNAGPDGMVVVVCYVVHSLYPIICKHCSPIYHKSHTLG